MCVFDIRGVSIGCVRLYIMEGELCVCVCVCVCTSVCVHVCVCVIVVCGQFVFLCVGFSVVGRECDMHRRPLAF